MDGSNENGSGRAGGSLRRSGTYNLRNRLSASIHNITLMRRSEPGRQALLTSDESCSSEEGEELTEQAVSDYPAGVTSSDDEEKVKTLSLSKRERRKESKERKRQKKKKKKKKDKDADEKKPETPATSAETELPHPKGESENSSQTSIPLDGSPKILPKEQRKRQPLATRLKGGFQHFFTFDHISHLRIPLVQVPLFLVLIPFGILACLVLLFYFAAPDYSIYASVSVINLANYLSIRLTFFKIRLGNGARMQMLAF